MASTPTSKSSTPTITASNGKSVILRLKVSKDILSKFPRSKSSSPIVESTAQSIDVKEDKTEGNTEKTNGVEKKDTTKADVKKDTTGAAATTTTTTTAPKPRSRPGPKRRKVETEDQQPWTVTMTGPGAHKLGPKANQGAINAGLRALDRSGKQCRKWGKKQFNLKTFNGSNWSMINWSGALRSEVKENGVDDSTPSTNSEIQQASSNVPSIASREAKDIASPAPIAASA